jgi:hypothetical protein
LETVAATGAKKTVNLENLEGRGARRLAEILLEFGEEDARIKRRLRLELAGETGADVIAADITKRLAALKRAQSFIDWPKRRSFVKDIDLQREMITTKVAEARPDLALDLMWRFMELAEPILNRVDDSYGDVGDVFRHACRDLGAIAVKASPDPIHLADRVSHAVTTNDYGEYDQLVHGVFSALKETGVARLKSRLATAFDRAAEDQRPLRLQSGCAHARTAKHRRPRRRCGRVHGARERSQSQVSENSRRDRKPSARCRKSARSTCGLERGLTGARQSFVDRLELAWVEALLATNRRDEAQSFRWSCFEHRLNASHLRAYLKGLPDFEDVLAEEKALDYALTFPHFTTALAFFIDWKEQR